MADTQTLQTMVLLKGTAMIGKLVHYPTENGWMFISNTSAHGNSRKYWPTANKAIPNWAFKLSDEMLTWDEFKGRLAKSDALQTLFQLR